MLKSIRYYLIPCLILFSGITGYSQKFIFTPEIGYGTFNMKDLKQLQDELSATYYFETEEVEIFPPYIGYGLSAQYLTPSGFTFGIASDLFSTGGRNHIGDYSGDYKIDLLAHAYNLMALAGYEKRINNNFSYGFEFYTGVKLSYLEIIEKIEISEYKSSDNIELRSVSWLIKPIARIEFRLTDFMAIGLFAGYELNPGSNLHLPNKRKEAFLHPDGNKVKINWSGIRTGLSLSFIL